MNTAVGIKRPKKADRIAADLLAHIRDGRLQPGDRLSGMTQLRKMYRASQRVVKAALEQLEEQGLITIQPRSGSYVADDAPVHVSGAAQPEVPQGTPGLDYFTRPKSSQDVLTVYLTELYPENLTIWREELDVLRPQLDVERIHILTCADGHPQEVLRDRSVDLALITPAVLQAIGPEQFVELTDPTAFGVQFADCLPPVREFLQHRKRLAGMPFSIMLNHLFINEDLARQAGVAELSVATVPNLLQAAGNARESLARLGAAAMRGTGHMHDLLLNAGALTCTADGTLKLDNAIAEDVLEHFVAAGIKGADRDDDVQYFAAGRLLYLSHCSYQAVEFARTCAFDWTMRPAPTSPGVMRPGELMFLSITRRTAALGKALDLVKHMLSARVQQRFARLHGNLPILAAALEEAVVAGHPLALKDLLKQLETTTLTMQADSLQQMHRRLGMRDEERALAAGELTPREAVARLQLHLQCCR